MYIYQYLKSIYVNCLETKEKFKIIKKWELGGCIIPPPHVVKQEIINSYRKKHRINTLVETGTYLGEMVQAQLNNFKSIHSIELSEELHLLAKNKFSKSKNVTLWLGDSSNVLKKVLEKTQGRIIFWLDGHYSEGITAKGQKNCPVWEELEAIFQVNNNKHIILIDDARYFNGKNDYPNINDIENYFKNKNISVNLEIKHDVIRIILI